MPRNYRTQEPPRPVSPTRASVLREAAIKERMNKEESIYGNTASGRGRNVMASTSDKAAVTGLTGRETPPPPPVRPGTSKPQDRRGSFDPIEDDPEDDVETGKWDILTGFLKLSTQERDNIVEDQLQLINPSNINMVRAAIMGKVGQNNFKATAMLIKLMEYEGFNPVVTISEMSKRADDWNSTPRSEVWNLTHDGMQFTITERATIAKDVLFLVSLFLTRGNNLRKILATINKEIKTPLMVKIQTYKIKSDSDEDAARRKRAEKIDMTSKDITLSRLTASFPQIALSIVLQTGIPGKVEMTCFKLLYKIRNSKAGTPPAILTHGLIPSLLPKSEDANTAELKRFCYFFNVEQSVTLQMPSMRKNVISEPISKVLESAEKFVDAAISGPLNSDNQRIILLQHLGLYNPEDDVKEWVQIGADLYARSITAGSYYMLQSQLAAEAARI